MARKIFGVVIATALLAVPAGIFAQEHPEPEPTIGLGDVGQGSLLFSTDTPGRYIPAPMQSTEVEIAVRGLVVEATVRQSFHNPGDEWLEGVYVFPLPQKAAVHAMRLEIGERVIEGLIKEREAARKVYEQAKKEGRKASLVEQERPNIFTTSVANIGPGEKVAVRISYQQILEYDSGRFELRFPMVVGTRYIPGSAVTTRASTGTGWAFDTDQVEDASRVTPPVLHPDQGVVNPVRLEVSLDAGMPLERLNCPSHAAQIKKTADDVHSIRLDGVPADRDFVLEWTPARGSEPRAAVFTEELDGSFYVLAMLMPPDESFTETVRLPREVIFVVDTSGSMGGTSIIQARDALMLALEQLAPEDYFNIIEFDSNFTKLHRDSVPAMPAAIEGARQWVAGLQADGGTEMMGPLVAALEDAEEHTPLRQVVFITDGCVGNEDALFQAIHQELGRSRLFTIGIGSAPNSHFMERAASFGRGDFTHIGTPSEVSLRMGEFFAKLENPVLADIELQWPDPDAEAWPEQVPDLYAGRPVVVTARLGTVRGDLVATGIRTSESWEARTALSVGSARAGVNRIWARRKIASIMDQRARGVSEDEVRPQVVEVALAHSLVSKYTSLVAVDVTPTRPIDEKMRTGAVPTNLPAGWKYEKVFGALPKGATASRLHLLTALLAIVLGVLVRQLRSVL
ncbi:MAG: marine proteobacterial sortase target protein [Thermoanaerobaculales bacterium]|nr:marine proteobacterial sortase target protein [Thermoanaerobaculales bacterium]